MASARLARQSEFQLAPPGAEATAPDGDHRLTATTPIERMWSALYELLRDPCVGFAARHVGDEAAADIFQDVMLSYWKRRATLATEEFNEARIMASVRNRIVSQLKRDRRAVPLTEEMEEAGIVPSIGPFAPDMHVDMTDAILDAVNKLAPQRRRAWTLRYIDGFTREQTAEMMGIKPATLTVHVFKAGILIREALKDAGFQDQLIERGFISRSLLPATTEASR